MNFPMLEMPRGRPIPGPDQSSDEPEQEIHSYVRLGRIGIGVLVLIFVIWACLVPLQSAAVAVGVLRAEGGGRKVVQHLEGGIIRRLLVSEGSKVKAGQVLVELDDTQSSAQLAAAQSDYDALLAQDARLTAERSGAARVTYPDELLARRSDPSVQAVLKASDAMFIAGSRALGQQAAVVRQRVRANQAELGATGPQAAALRKQSESLAKEIAAVETLVNERLDRRGHLLQLQRQQADLESQQSQISASAQRLSSSVSEMQAQIGLLSAQRFNDAATQQRDVQTSLALAREKLRAARDIFNRRRVVAPVDGTVVNLRLVTPGGVLPAGQPLLDIVPDHERIVVIARLKANDVDVVQPGLLAEVRLMPYKTRSVPTLLGKVLDVAADVTIDDRSGAPYYETEIALDRQALDKLKGVKLLSGMPTEVYIQLGQRTLMQYLLQPLHDSFNRAFRED